ncbi:hypothetical protein VTI74DRAFT_8861 [Chaetomium olivicolor]
MDFGETNDEEFRGILDIELSHLLQATTKKTDNVTVILDCCHAGRMARDVTHGDNATPKQLLEVRHHDLARWVQILRKRGQLGEQLAAADSNPYVVRITACAERETAWEYFRDGEWGGVLTRALVCALSGTAVDERVSWKTLLLRVEELVHAEFPQQHPRAEGPSARGCFSTTLVPADVFRVRVKHGTAFLEAGRVAGVRERNRYVVMPPGATGIDSRVRIAEATVERVTGFRSAVKLEFGLERRRVPSTGALAFLSQEALCEWPVVLPGGFPGLRKAVEESAFLRPYDGDTDASYLAEFRDEDGKITLHTEGGVQIASQQFDSSQAAQAASEPAFAAVKQAAETLAKAQHLIQLSCENKEEHLDHQLEVEFATLEEGGRVRRIEQDGSGFIRAGDGVIIALRNAGDKTVYVSVFNVNVAGKIELLSGSSPRGVWLKAGQYHTLGNSDWDPLDTDPRDPGGLETSWPANVPTEEPVAERHVFVVTNDEVDLTHLETSAGPERIASRRSDLQSGGLEEFTYCLASGTRRDTRNRAKSRLLYDVFEIPFTMVPQTEGPPTEWDEQPAYPQDNMVGKNLFGQAYRALRGIPPYVWVVNQHSEEITAVVSKYRPNRMLQGAGLSASATGGGANYNTTTYNSPPTTKVLAPSAAGPARSMARFPLWTGKSPFGVISIFIGTGPDKRPFIENDRITMGATAYFRNEPDLTIVRYGEGAGRHIEPLSHACTFCVETH